ncbi:hypothetical protein CEXT_276731 [Caerostris extrusa]|uniref:Uncharacterized protein n=1 Tax=Caerostris extrusa TaxID=172846 RepID=A0AAV4QHI3_CAEEX|nr:hypothetical protein CEXT_276731 [Caerostris extrusa]
MQKSNRIEKCPIQGELYRCPWEDNIVRNYGIVQEAAIQELVRLEPSQEEAVPLIQISVMAPIDCTEPNVEDI